MNYPLPLRRRRCYERVCIGLASNLKSSLYDYDLQLVLPQEGVDGQSEALETHTSYVQLYAAHVYALLENLKQEHH